MPKTQNNQDKGLLSQQNNNNNSKQINQNETFDLSVMDFINRHYAENYDNKPIKPKQQDDPNSN